MSAFLGFTAIGLILTRLLLWEFQTTTFVGIREAFRKRAITQLASHISALLQTKSDLILIGRPPFPFSTRTGVQASSVLRSADPSPKEAEPESPWNEGERILRDRESEGRDTVRAKTNTANNSGGRSLAWDQRQLIFALLTGPPTTPLHGTRSDTFLVCSPLTPIPHHFPWHSSSGVVIREGDLMVLLSNYR